MATTATTTTSNNPIADRNDLSNFLISLLTPLNKYTSPGGARIRVGSTAAHFDDLAAQLEGFARPLWGLSSFLHGQGHDNSQSIPFDGTKNWQQGFKHGPDPSHPEFWGNMKDRDQRMVECSPIGFSLAVAPDVWWNPLSDENKANLETWLGGLNDKKMPNTNWLWFRVSSF